MSLRQVLLLAILLWTPLLLVRPPSRQQELRVLVTARNMVESGDWLHPTFQNRPRYRKPPLAYWLAAVPMAITGVMDQPALARLPFLALALSILCLTATLAGADAGARVALLLVFSIGLGLFTPLAETDLPLLFGILLASIGGQRHNGWICGSGLAIGFLAKGPAGIAIPLLTLLILQRVDRRSVRFWLTALTPSLGTSLAWGLFLWMDPMANQALAQELKATFWDTAHENPWYYYVITLPWMLLPGVALLLRRFPTNRMLAPASSHSRFFGVWFWVTLVLLTLTISKQRHYALLLLPPTAGWLALRWPSFRTIHLSHAIAAVSSISLLASWMLYHQKDAAHARFLSRVSQILPHEGTLHVVGINSAIFDYQFGRHVENTDSAQLALLRAQPGDTVTIVQRRSDWDAEAFPIQPTLEADQGEWIRRHYLR